MEFSGIAPPDTSDITSNTKFTAHFMQRSIKCLMSCVGEHGRVVAHFDQAHFNQSLQITWIDGR